MPEAMVPFYSFKEEKELEQKCFSGRVEEEMAAGGGGVLEIAYRRDLCVRGGGERVCVRAAVRAGVPG